MVICYYMAKFEKRIQARLLRRKGQSTGDIASKLGISKSTVSIWCGDIKLSKNLREKLFKNQSKGRRLGSVANKNKKMAAIQFYLENAQKQVGRLNERDLLMVATALYWAEGSKSDSTAGFMFINSDPIMVHLIKRFLNQVLSIENSDIVCTVQINKLHKPRIGKVLKFWSNLLGLPAKQFNKPYYIDVKPSKVYENYNMYYGTLRMKVKKSSRLKYYMLGLIQVLKGGNMPA